MFGAKGVEEIDEIDDDGSNSCSQDIVDERGGDFTDLPGKVKQDDPAQQLFSNSKESKKKSRKKKKNSQGGSTNRDTSKNIENMEVMKVEPRRPSTSCFPHEQTSPWLIFFSHGKKGKLHTLYSLESHESYKKSIPQLVNKSCKAFTHGWLLMQDWVTDELTLLNPMTMERIDLPAPPEVSPDDHIYNNEYSSWVITAPPTCASCIILISYHTDPFFIFCYVHERKWRKATYPSSTGEDGGLKNFAICDGIIYACTPVNTTPCVVSFDLYQVNIKPIPVPEPYVPFGLYHSLLGGFGGYLYSVNFVNIHCTTSIVNVNVFKMDFGVNKWVKVETVGELTFFVDNVNDSVLCYSDNVPGIKKDCVYYMGYDDILYRYDLATRGITIESSFRRLKDPFYAPCWVLPAS